MFFKGKEISYPFERTDHLAHSPGPSKNKKFQPKKFLALTQKLQFFEWKVFHTRLKEPIFYPKKKVLLLT